MLRLLEPKSGNVFKESGRLMLINFVYILLTAGLMLFFIIFFSFLAEAHIWTTAVFGPVVVFYLAAVAAAYFYIWIRYSVAFAKQQTAWRKGKTFLIGFIGVIPNIAFLFGALFFDEPESCAGAIMFAVPIFFLSSILMPFVSLISAFIKEQPAH